MSFLVVVGFLSALLASPTLARQPSLAGFGRAFLISSFGVVLPLAVFFLSAFLVPEWKGGCKYGWVDCFHEGKLALSPIVFWATAALYCVELFPEQSRHTRWAALGLFAGATVASVCLVFGIVVVPPRHSAMVLWLSVCAYIAVWQSVRAVQLMRWQRPGFVPYVLTFFGSIPFWIASAIWSRNVYDRLPENPPGCFVVTAASRGHPRLVGPFTDFIRHGRRSTANRQLARFWAFEALWQSRWPRSHAFVRKIYNRIGPKVAARISSPWRADVIYVVLKPVEWFACGIVLVVAFSRNRRVGGCSNL